MPPSRTPLLLALLSVAAVLAAILLLTSVPPGADNLDVPDGNARSRAGGRSGRGAPLHERAKTPPREAPVLSPGERPEPVPEPVVVGSDVPASSVWPPSPAGIVGAMEESRAAFEACLARNAGLSTLARQHLEVLFTIMSEEDSGEGMARVTDARPTGELPEALRPYREVLEDCVLGAMKDQQFDPPAEGTVYVIFPLSFGGEDRPGSP